MRRTVRSAPLLAVLLAMLTASTALAAAGDLDSSFGGDGIVTTNFTRRIDAGFALAIQPDGKLVVAGGSAFDGRDGRFAIARYNPDGSLDTTFGGDGKVTTNFSRYVDDAAGVAIQADGKIVVAGDARLGSGNSAFAVARYEADGTLDAAFGGGDGRVVTQFTRRNDGVAGLALQANGKIVVSGGTGFDARVSKLAVARYESDGSLDTTFDGDGRVMVDISEGIDYANAVIAQPDGKIVAGGLTVAAEQQVTFLLARFNADGTLDGAFGTDGVVATAMSNRGSDVQALALQPDMRIIAAGYAIRARPHALFALARYNSDGTLDTSFGGGDGRTLTNFTAGEDYGLGVALQTDGRIVVAGLAGRGADETSNAKFAVARYEPDGSLDATFGSEGTVITNITAGYDWSRGIVVQADGNIVASGGADSEFAIVRYLGA